MAGVLVVLALWAGPALGAETTSRISPIARPRAAVADRDTVGSATASVGLGRL